ncbi:hypothetical protein DSO57_1034387 [Entomophthora muscae]|uniref:Uncharacterized protein n=1 Tax=Entomophthora muscae TaxID=34485 RepID=A0ACC2RQV2_9FUNG|nr:hypothetical protein DSO57_1034387 [Entomophthora muscae]
MATVNIFNVDMGAVAIKNLNTKFRAKVYEAMDAYGASLSWLQDSDKFFAEFNKFSTHISEDLATTDQN